MALSHVRNISEASIFPSPGLNGIVGENASGKSSLLEAIYLLGRGNSFRTNQLSQMIQFSADRLWVSGQSLTPSDVSIQLGVEIGRRKKKLKLQVTVERHVLNSLTLCHCN